MYGYQLRHEFERSTGHTWALNVGQVYTTLARLERDGLVEQAGAAEDESKVVYRLTEAGRGELAGWFMTPVGNGERPRDELAVKVTLALATPGVDVEAVVRAQRRETERNLHELVERKESADAEGDTEQVLIVAAMAMRAEAELRWLDYAAASLPTRPGTDTGGTAD